MSRKTFHNLLKRYLEGTCTEEERKIVEQWYGMLDDEDLQEIQSAELAVIDEKIWNSIQSRTTVKEIELPERPVRSLWTKLAVAASLSGILLLTFYFVNRPAPQPDFLVLKTEQIEKINNSAQPMEILLEDGSNVLLQPQSRLTYPKKFSVEKREVYVEGEAFFQITKNKTRPFFVYSNDLITEVVGTSFTVKTGDKTHESEVAVLTGKVMVSKNPADNNLYQNLMALNQGKVVLTPNQRVIYQPKTDDLIVTLVQQPAPVQSEEGAVAKIDFTFNDTPLNEVLETLEETYGIEITSENEGLYKCTFTGDIADQNLYTKLDFICQAVGATYEIDGAQIVITGGHCK